MFAADLSVTNELAVIGHRFRDNNIVSLIRAGLETRREFRLTIVNPEATELKKSIFNNNQKVNAVDSTIEEWVRDESSEYKENGVKFFEYINQKSQEDANVLERNIINKFLQSEEFYKIKQKILEEAKKSVEPSRATSHSYSQGILNQSPLNLLSSPNILDAVNATKKLSDVNLSSGPRLQSNIVQCPKCGKIHIKSTAFLGTCSECGSKIT